MTGNRKFCCWRLLRDQSAHLPVLPKQTLIMVQGKRMHGCYYPLSKGQLVWQISINDVSKQIEKKLTEIMQARTVTLNYSKSQFIISTYVKYFQHLHVFLVIVTVLYLDRKLSQKSSNYVRGRNGCWTSICLIVSGVEPLWNPWSLLYCMRSILRRCATGLKESTQFPH